MATPVTVVTGGLGLIGGTCIAMLVERGHVCVALDPAPGARAAAVEHIACDVASERSVARALESVRRRYGHVDNLVHSPSIQPPGFGADLPGYEVTVWRRVLDVHVTGAMLMTRALVPLMTRRRSGCLVFLGSIYGVVAPSFALYGAGRPAPPLVYTASKAALIGMARWIAARYGRQGIRCNVVSPGGIAESPWPSPSFRRRYAARAPLGRPVAVEDVARAIAWVLEAGHVTGHSVILDGVWTSA